MNKYASLCIIMLALCSFEHDCEKRCQWEGDAHGFVLDDICYCGNPTDLKRSITRVPKYGKTVKVKYESNYTPGEM